jgi:3-carboxy-cis,cis-muconate cycloisomerase
MSFYRNFFYSPAATSLFDDEATVGYLLQFEAALAQAQATHGMIPASAAQVIAENCVIKNIDIELLVSQIGLGGNACIPLVKQLTQVVKIKNAEAAAYVHFGATSQDAIDTATMLQAKDAVLIIKKKLSQLIQQLQVLSQQHQQSPMIGRSFMQQARPISFGFKVDTWLDGLQRSQIRIERLLEESFVLQLGGAVGNKAAFGEKGNQISQTMADLLALCHTHLAWHTQRDRLADIAATLGILTATISKIAKDISLMMQTEIAEVFEPLAEGKGGSSTMPHKRNPVSSIAILANAERVPHLVATMLSCMTQDHERATGQWHAEWDTLSQIIQLAAGTTHQAIIMTNGLEVNTTQMLKNLDATNGLIYAEVISLALAEHIGKNEAHLLIQKYCQEAIKNGLHLKEHLKVQPMIEQYFNDQALENLFS